MKKLFYISAACLTLAVQGTAFAGNATINPQDFKYLVCSYIEDHSSLDDALDSIYAVTDELTINNAQIKVFQDLIEGSLTSEDYCAGLEF